MAVAKLVLQLGICFWDWVYPITFQGRWGSTNGFISFTYMAGVLIGGRWQWPPLCFRIYVYVSKNSKLLLCNWIQTWFGYFDQLTFQLFPHHWCAGKLTCNVPSRVEKHSKEGINVAILRSFHATSVILRRSGEKSQRKINYFNFLILIRFIKAVHSSVLKRKLFF